MWEGEERFGERGKDRNFERETSNELAVQKGDGEGERKRG